MPEWNASILRYATVWRETTRPRTTTSAETIGRGLPAAPLSSFVARHPGKRLHPFEALHLTYALARGLEAIHAVREYHGDLHDTNVLVSRVGILFDVKVVDFYHWGAPTAAHRFDDVADLIRLLYDAVGGRRRYASQPPVIKNICRGLRKDLIRRAFPTARHLREHLETFSWA